MLNKRLNRLRMAKRLIAAQPNASPEEIARAVQAAERAKPRNKFKSVGELLAGFRRKP